MTALSKGQQPGPEASIAKIVVAPKLQDLSAFATELEGEVGALKGDDAPMDGMFQMGWMSAPGLRIAGGTDEILQEHHRRTRAGPAAGRTRRQGRAVQQDCRAADRSRAMPLDTLDHYTINCADMEKTRDFYRDVLDLKEGFRPDLPFPGYWMYCGDAAGHPHPGAGGRAAGEFRRGPQQPHRLARPCRL